MKTKSLILILFTSFISSCNQSTKDKPDDDFGIEQKIEGEFIGEFVKSEQGLWGSLVFKNGKGDSVAISDYICYNGDMMSNLKLTKNVKDYKVDGSFDPYYFCPESPKTQLQDSLYQFPEKFAGKLFKVKWCKFLLGDNEVPSEDSPILISISYPNENIVNSENNKTEITNSNTPEESNTKQENDSRLTIGEIRGMVYGSTLSQVEEEIGCINYNWEGENNSENDNCPGKRLQVNSGLMCLDYNFVVYKDFVLNSKKEVSDLLIVVKDWGKTYSKVTYVGIFNGNLDPYEHCQDR